MRQLRLLVAACGLVVLATGCGSGSGLFVVGADGGKPRKVASGCIQYFAWSPDGNRIALTTLGRDESTVKVVDLRQGRTESFGAGGSNRPLTWSPDGSSISFEVGQGIVVATLKDGKRRKLIPSVAAYSPAWAPDGKRIAFEAFGSRGDRIALVRPDGRGLTYITAKMADASAPLLWFPDGRHLLFLGAVFGVPEPAPTPLRRISADGSVLTTIVKEPLISAMYYSISPHGERVAYSVPGGSRIAHNRLVDQPDRIYVVNVDGSGKRYLANGKLGSWSPSGKQLLLSSNGGLYAVNVDDTRSQKIAPHASDGGIADLVASWSSHGDIAYIVDADSCGGSD